MILNHILIDENIAIQIAQELWGVFIYIVWIYVNYCITFIYYYLMILMCWWHVIDVFIQIKSF